MRSVEIRNGRLFYYGSAVGYLEGDGITADPMFRREDLERWLERKNLPVRWVDGVYDRLASGGPIQNARPLKSLRIWQLKPDTPIEMRFIGLERMAREFDGPNPSQYRIAYDGQAESQELEDIWNKFCRRTLPGGERPLAISDVIELYDTDESAFYYVDKREIVHVGPPGKCDHTRAVQKGWIRSKTVSKAGTGVPCLFGTAALRRPIGASGKGWRDCRYTGSVSLPV